MDLCDQEASGAAACTTTSDDRTRLCAPAPLVVEQPGKFVFLGPPVKDELRSEKEIFDTTVLEHQHALQAERAAYATAAGRPSSSSLVPATRGTMGALRPLRTARADVSDDSDSDAVRLNSAGSVPKEPSHPPTAASPSSKTTLGACLGLYARRGKAANHSRSSAQQVCSAFPVSRNPRTAAEAAGLAAAAAAAEQGLTPQQCNSRRQNARRAELKRSAKAAELLPDAPISDPPVAPKRLMGAVAEMWERKVARHSAPASSAADPS